MKYLLKSEFICLFLKLKFSIFLSSFFDRDVQCVRELFRRKYNYESEDYPKFSDIKRDDNLDTEVHCTGYGFTKEMEKDLLKVQFKLFSKLFSFTQ